MLHTLYRDALCFEVSVSHMYNVLDLIFIVQWLFCFGLFFLNFKQYVNYICCMEELLAVHVCLAWFL